MFRVGIVGLNPYELRPGEATDLIVAALISPFCAPPEVFDPSKSWDSAGWLLRVVRSSGWSYYIDSSLADPAHTAFFRARAHEVNAAAETTALAVCRAFVLMLAVMLEAACKEDWDATL